MRLTRRFRTPLPLLLAFLLTALLALVACAGGSADAEPSPPSPPSPSATRSPATVKAQNVDAPGPTDSAPCGWTQSAPAKYRHVIWIWFENKNYDQVVGHLPYLDKIADKCGLATNFHSLTHPSLPNYIALTSGGFHGVHTDCEPTSCPVSARSLFRQLQRHDMTWKGYAESMPGRCVRVTSGSYAARHNPATYYTDIRRSCKKRNVPLRSDRHGLRHDLATHKLPDFSYVTPNICNDLHDCDLPTGNRWAKRWLGRILDSDAWANGRTAVFVTFDEGAGGGSCTPQAEHCHIATWVLGPSVPPGTRVDRRLDHFSLLKSTSNMLGLDRPLGHAADARGMRAPFGL